MTVVQTEPSAAPPPSAEGPRPLMLYDGECGLCDKSLRFVLRHESDHRMHFAPLQSDLGRRTLVSAGFPADYVGSILYVDDAGRVFSHSNAAWHIATHLAMPYRRLAAVRFIPRPIRDLGYRFVAAIRFRLFGGADAKKTCSILPPDQRQRIHL